MLDFGGVFVLVGLILLAAAFAGAVFAVKFAFSKLPSDAGIRENSILRPRLTVSVTALWIALWTVFSIISLYVTELDSNHEVLTPVLVHGATALAFLTVVTMFLILNFQIGMVNIFGDAPRNHYERESSISRNSRLLTYFVALVLPLAIVQAVLIELNLSSGPRTPESGWYNPLVVIELAISLIFFITALVSLVLMKTWAYYPPLLIVGVLSFIRNFNTVVHDIVIVVGIDLHRFTPPGYLFPVWYVVMVLLMSWTTVIGLIILLHLLATYFSDSAAEASPVDDRRPLLDGSWEPSAGTFTRVIPS